MHLERLFTSDHPHFPKALALYESAFPWEERRETAVQATLLPKEAYHFELIMEGNMLQGILLYWETADFLYLEHFATLPEVRNHGVGSAALQLLKSKGKTVILEIEPPADTLTKRRLAFYSRNGFRMTPHYHIQPKYHIGDKDLELKILSYPTVITAKAYHRFRDFLEREVSIFALCSTDPH